VSESEARGASKRSEASEANVNERVRRVSEEPSEQILD